MRLFTNCLRVSNYTLAIQPIFESVQIFANQAGIAYKIQKEKE